MKAFVNKGDELFHGMAEVPTPTASDEKDLVIKVDAAPINASDTGSAGRLASMAVTSLSSQSHHKLSPELSQLTATSNWWVARVWV